MNLESLEFEEFTPLAAFSYARVTKPESNAEILLLRRYTETARGVARQFVHTRFASLPIYEFPRVDPNDPLGVDEIIAGKDNKTIWEMALLINTRNGVPYFEAATRALLERFSLFGELAKTYKRDVNDPVILCSGDGRPIATTGSHLSYLSALERQLTPQLIASLPDLSAELKETRNEPHSQKYHLC